MVHDVCTSMYEYVSRQAAPFFYFFLFFLFISLGFQTFRRYPWLALARYCAARALLSRDTYSGCTSVHMEKPTGLSTHFMLLSLPVSVRSGAPPGWFVHRRLPRPSLRFPSHTPPPPCDRLKRLPSPVHFTLAPSQ